MQLAAHDDDPLRTLGAAFVGSGADRCRACGRAERGPADCDSLCVAAAELVERFELREGAAPVRERAGWQRPKKIVVADVPLADYLRTIAPGVEIVGVPGLAQLRRAWPRSLPAPTC